MNKPPLLSILTPACWERVNQAQALRDKIQQQIGSSLIEHLVLFDNRNMSIGQKRQLLVNAARGQFIAFCDDDDDVATDYVPILIRTIQQNNDIDVITFEQEAVYNGKAFTVKFQLNATDQNLILDGPDNQLLIRGPWHVCAWKKERIAHCQFLHCNYGEDAAWVEQARRHVFKSHHIPSVLHYYRHDKKLTLAPELL